ncbi:Hypothetical predicted protein [Olea europaea subsp. europaea]|uniref:Uncharacterized protein n=1 Tax=Olea europaea subsp. europaea TaxID=158383 RepID=A0A8S0S6V5_OLEEU|nr:Hypothetical predicted protein [Olea europaea subsp. europaea]
MTNARANLERKRAEKTVKQAEVEKLQAEEAKKKATEARVRAASAVDQLRTSPRFDINFLQKAFDDQRTELERFSEVASIEMSFGDTKPEAD